MKIFYLLTLTFGLLQAVMMQFVDFAMPRDAFVASVLAHAPENWTLSIGEGLKGRLENSNVKEEVTIALQRRASFAKEMYTQSFWEGLGIIVFSVIGLMREKKIAALRNMVSQSAALNATSHEASPA